MSEAVAKGENGSEWDEPVDFENFVKSVAELGLYWVAVESTAPVEKQRRKGIKEAYGKEASHPDTGRRLSRRRVDGT